MTPGLDPATVTRRTDAATEVVDWGSALAAAGIDHGTDGEVAWHREPERLAVRDAEPGSIDVHGGILEDEPLVLVLVLLARDGNGSVTASMLSGRPVAHADGPLVGPHGVCTPESFEQAVSTFERAVAARSVEERLEGRSSEPDTDAGEHPPTASSG